jgi:hypothetical protein
VHLLSGKLRTATTIVMFDNFRALRRKSADRWAPSFPLTLPPSSPLTRNNDIDLYNLLRLVTAMGRLDYLPVGGNNGDNSAVLNTFNRVTNRPALQLKNYGERELHDRERCCQRH